MVGKEFTRKCLKCQKVFTPTDRRKNWICPPCSKDNTRTHSPKIISTVSFSRGPKPSDISGD